MRPARCSRCARAAQVRLIGPGCRRVDAVQGADSLLRTFGFSNRRGSADERTDCRRFPNQSFVQDGDPAPVGASASRAFHVRGLQRGFELKATVAPLRRRCRQLLFRFVQA